jgi:hypothetical protein
MAMGAMIQIGNTDGTLVAARMPRVTETPKPRPAGMATEFQRNIKPPRKGKGTRKQRKEESMRANRRIVSLAFYYRWEIKRAMLMTTNEPNSRPFRYGSKAHRRALAKLTQ